MTQLSTLSGRLLDIELGSADSTVLFTTERRIQGINDGIREFADLTECHLRRSSATLTGGTAEYSLLSTAVIPGGDFVRPAADQPVEFWYTDASSNVTILAGDDLPQITVRGLDRSDPEWQISTVASSVQQLPQQHYFRIEGGVHYLGFTPVPSTGSSASMKAIIPYVALPPRIASTATTEEPFTVDGVTRTDLRPFHQAFVHYAAAQLEKLRKNTEGSQAQMAAFLAYVQRFLATVRPKGGMRLTYVKNYFRRDTVELDPRR